MAIKNENVTQNVKTYLTPITTCKNPVILCISKVGRNLSGFTLAEVLITLVIIGVIAALTIPTLMQNMNEKATVTKLKKVHATLNNAVQAAVAENGTIDTWDFPYPDNPSGASQNGANAKEFAKIIKPYLKVAKDCGTGQGCWTNTQGKYLRGSDWYDMNGSNTRNKMILSDGLFLAIYLGHPNCNENYTTSNNTALKSICGYLTVDIDGFKGENTIAKDVFRFYITKNGQVVPQGLAEDTNFPISTTCVLSTGTGHGCVAWVIYRENMDYLKGKAVAW